MKIRFIRDTTEFEAKPGFKAGDVIEATPDVVAKWTRRKAAEVVTAEKSVEAVKPSQPQESPTEADQAPAGGKSKGKKGSD